MHCLLYARVSTDKQAQRDLSIPAQLQLMREYAKKQGWTVVAHYVDEGESARTASSRAKVSPAILLEDQGR